jgi:hypothetical protein
VSDMDQEDVFEALAEVGIEIRTGASFKAMKAALITHHNGRAMSAEEVFRRIDTDRSGTLNVKEVDRASGILGASIGCVLSAREVERYFKLMDIDNDGEVNTTEFEVFWRGMEAEQLVGDMTEDEVRMALAEAGIEVAGSATLDAMRAALKGSHAGRCARRCFAHFLIDTTRFDRELPTSQLLLSRN